MSRMTTNQAKREAMKAVIEALFARGWTAVRLAAYFNHTPSAVSAWKLGKSMGTNAERAEMVALPVASDPKVLGDFAAKLLIVRKVIAKALADLAKFQTPDYLAEMRVKVVNNNIKMVEYYESDRPKNRLGERRWSYETEAEFQTRHSKMAAQDKAFADQHRAVLGDGQALDAKAAECVASDVAGAERLLAMKREYEALLEKALDSYRAKRG